MRVALNLRCVAGGNALVAALSLKRVAVTLPKLKAKRLKLDNTVKLQIIAAAEKYGPSYAVRIRMAHNTSGFHTAITLSVTLSVT